jgi:hypothetical protein
VPAPAAEVIERLCRETAERFGFLVPHRDD